MAQKRATAQSTGVRMEGLEGRTLLSAAPADAELPDTSVTLRVSATATPPTLTRLDRLQFLAHLTPDWQKPLRTALRHRGSPGFDETLLSLMRKRDGVAYFYRPKSLPGIVDWLDTHLAGRAGQQVTRADNILAHKFPEQVSSGEYAVQLPAGEIDWGTQPTTTSNPGFLHALNRHGYWRELAMAHQITGNGKYVRELIAQLKSWSAQTPALADPEAWRGVPTQWSPLDAADRVRNWIETYYRVIGSADWTPEANTLFLSRLYDHGDFLHRVAPSAYTKNRTAVHGGALVRVGILFPLFADAPAWERDGFDITFRCLGAQFYPDGGHVEQTPAYQAATANAMFEGYYLAQLNGRTNWTKPRRQRLQNAIESLYQLMNPNGQLSGLSDTYRTTNVGPFVFRAGFAFGDERYKHISTPTIDDVLLVGPKRLGTQFLNQVERLPNRGPSFAMPDSGYYIMRGAEGTLGNQLRYSDTQVVIDAGRKGGTHGHFDLFSFEFQRLAEYVLVPDPGPYIYDDSADRAYVISTRAHNTLSIDGQNHRGVGDDIGSTVIVDEFRTDGDEGVFTGHHRAYDHLAGEPVVGRTIWIDRRPDTSLVMLVVDWAKAAASHTYTTSFNLASEYPRGTPVRRESPGIVDVQFTATNHMRVQSLGVAGQTSRLVDSFVSPKPPPDTKAPAKRLAVSQTGQSATFVTLISDYVKSKNTGQVLNPPVTARLEASPADGQPVKVELIYPDGSTRSLSFAPPDLS